MEDEPIRLSRRAELHAFEGDDTREVIGAYYDVYNALPRGLLESAYAGALFRELTLRRIPIEREVPLQLYYRGEPVGFYRADLIISRRLMLELKSMWRAGDRERSQLYHYMRVTHLPPGLILNFGPTPQILRVINSQSCAFDWPPSP